MVVGVNENTLYIKQGGLENTVANPPETVVINSKRYCNTRKGKEQEYEQSWTEEVPRSETDSVKTHHNAENLQVVDEIVRNVGSGPRLKYVVQWYSYIKADDTAVPPHHIPKRFIGDHWRQLDKHRKRKARSRAN